MSLVIDCSTLLESKVKIEEIWKDPQAYKQYEAQVTALNIIKGRQTAQFPDLTDPKKDKTVKVMWLTDCNDDDDAANCENECAVGGPEIEDNCDDYALDICLTRGFNVRTKVFRTSMWSKEEVIARSMLSKMQKLDEEIAQTIVSRLDAAVGENLFPAPYTFSAPDTIIPATNWTPELMAYLIQVKILNRMTDAYMLSGSNLFNAAQITKWNSGNDDGKGASAAFSSMQLDFDLFNIDPVVGAKKSYLIRPGAVAFVSKNYYGPTPVEIPGKAAVIQYSVPSKNIPGVVYDVLMDTECVADDNTKGEYIYKWSLMFKGGFFINPASCDGKNNGLLSFKCGT